MIDRSHQRFYRIADITIQVNSDLPITDDTFHPKFKLFEAVGPGKDTVAIRHHFSLPDLNGKNLGKEVYRRLPWAIYEKDNSWLYLGILPDNRSRRSDRIMVFNAGHTRGRIYNDRKDAFLKGGYRSLTGTIPDQIFLARVLADRKGCYLHACGVNLEGKGILFAGNSGAGKSTMAMMLKGKAEILCDDRIIVRRFSEGSKIYGTWSHGDVPDISADSLPLHAILFLKKADRNKLSPLSDKKEIATRLLACLIRPLTTVDWWEKTLALVGSIAGKISCYEFEFDKNSEVRDILKEL